MIECSFDDRNLKDKSMASETRGGRGRAGDSKGTGVLSRTARASESVGWDGGWSDLSTMTKRSAGFLWSISDSETGLMTGTPPRRMWARGHSREKWSEL